MPRRLASRAALALLAAGPLALACAGAPRPNPDAPVLEALRLDGNRALSDKRIKARILTTGSSWIPFSRTHYFDEGVFETDLKRILRLYQANGFYKARIVERKVKQTGPDEVEVTVRIDEGPPTRVAERLIEGLDEAPEEVGQRLLDSLPLRPGDILVEEKYEALKARLAEGLRESGYAEVEVDGVVQVLLQRDEALITLGVDLGQRYRFGRLFVAGANQVPREKILEQAGQAIHEGELYSPSALSEAEGRIFDLGVFSAVKVTRGAPDRKAGTVPVVISVREAPFRTVRLGVGIGLDAERQELPRIIGEWVNRNFFGDLRRLTFNNQASLVLLSSPFERGGPSGGLGVAANSTLDFVQPGFLGSRDLALNTSLGFERGIEQLYRFNALNGRAGLLWRVNRNITLATSYNYSLFTLAVEGDAANPFTTATPEAVFDECAIRGERCLLAYLEQRLTWDRRDNAVDPTRGALLSLSLQEGSRYLGGRYDYLRVAPEVRGYLPVNRHVLAGRVMAGLLIPSADTTSSVLTRFHLGGSADQRGFGNRQLSPQVAIDPEDVDGTQVYTAAPVGGNAMLAANLEARFRLPADFGLVTFVDVGEVQPTISELRLSALHVAVGIGLRYRTVFGPIRLDVGYRVNTGSPDYRLEGVPVADNPLGIPLGPPTGVADPRIDPISRFAIHFSIGEAF